MPFLHVFPYSERPGTPAARMPAVPMAVRRERAARLRAAGQVAAARFLACAGWVADRAADRKRTTADHSEHFACVRLSCGLSSRARVMAARVLGGRRTLLAEAA